MHVFNSRTDFDAQMKSVKKWMRTGQALDGVADLQHDVAYSIGDSLVYWWVTPTRQLPPIWSVTVATMPCSPRSTRPDCRGCPQGRPHLHPRIQRYRRS